MHTIPEGSITLKGFGGTIVCPDKQGTVSLPCLLKGVSAQFVLSDVYFVPMCNVNLISETALVSAGMRTETIPGPVPVWRLFHGAKFLLQATMIARKWMVDGPGVYVSMVGGLSAFDWHARLGHPSLKRQRQILERANLDSDESQSVLTKVARCDACQRAKFTKLPHPAKTSAHADKPLARVHLDIVGLLNTTSHDGSKYLGVFTDDLSRFISAYHLRAKSELFDCIKDFTEFWEKQLGLKLLHLHMDNAGENLSNEVQQYCREHGIALELTVPYTPEMNSIAERTNQRMLRFSTTLSNLPWIIF